MRYSASGGRAWIGLGGVMGVAMGLGVAQAQEAGPSCPDCLKNRHAPAAHAAAGTPYMAPVVTEKHGGLLGRKRHSVTVYHQVAGQPPKAVAGPGAAPIGAPPSVVSTAPGESLAESHIQAPYGPASYGPESYVSDEMMAVAPGEPAPVGVMRTSFDQYEPGPAPAAPSGLNRGDAPGHATTGGPPPADASAAAPAYDPRIAMWHSVIQPGGSMVAGGDKPSLLTRLTDGETPLTRWAEKRQAKKLAKFYQTSGTVPYNPSASTVPSRAIMPPR